MKGPCTLPTPEAEAEAKRRRGPRLLQTNPSNPHIIRAFTASGTCPFCGRDNRGILRQSSSTVPRTTRCIRPAAPALDSDRMQPVARQRSGVQSVATGTVRNGIVHRWHSVATQCTWLQHSVLRCGVTLVLRRGRCPGGQQWRQRCGPGHGLSPGADVGGGWTQSRCRCGWGGGPNRGGDAGRYEASPV